MSEKKIRLMIIDDEPQIRKVLSYIILNSEIEKFEIIEIETAEDALRMLKVKEPDIIICDYLLENTSGIDFFKKISVDYPFVVKILISGNVNYGELRDAVLRGAVFKFLSKPFNEEEILSVLKEAVIKVRDNYQKKDLAERLKDF
ncbi:MAG: response regulator [Deltaproteobacteria bacterium]|nr:response regulator [Deltaproteobacteria bacterium]